MIAGIGLDLVDITRIQRNLDRFGDRFAHRILGPDEREIFGTRRDRAAFLAGRFAAKEAVIKALGSVLIDRPANAEIQIVAGDKGMPVVQLVGDLATQLDRYRIHVSITHERAVAAALVVIEKP